MRDGRDVQDGIPVGQGIVAGVVAERPFQAQRFPRVDITFDHHVGIGRDFQVVRFATAVFDGLFAQVAGEEKLIKPVGQRLWRKK